MTPRVDGFIVFVAGLLMVGIGDAAFAEPTSGAGWSVHDFCGDVSGVETVRQSPREVPVVAEADVVVAGGGVSGAIAALSAAEAGHSVILIEPRNHFGHEWAATYRCNAAGELSSSAGAFATGIWDAFGSHRVIEGERVDPIRLRVELHERIGKHPRIETFLYASPTGVVTADGRVRGILFVSHGGRQIVLAGAVIDATSGGRIAAAAGATFRRSWEGATTARRYARVTRQRSDLTEGTRRVSKGLGIRGDRFVVHPGFLEWSVEGPAVGANPGADLSTIHSLASVAGYGLLDQFEREGVDIEAEVSPETWIDQVPLVACQERWASDSSPTEDGERFGSVLPDGVEGLAVCGRTVVDGAGPVTLAAMVAVGEHAAGAASKLVAAAGPLPSSDQRRPASEVVDGKLEVRELLGGIEAGVEYPTIPQQAEAIPVRGQYDVVVVGGGTSGVIAAIAASREGANVALVEVLPNLGGTSSNQVDSYYWGVPWKSLLRLELGERIELDKRDDPGGLEKVRFSGPAKVRALLEMARQAEVEIYFRSFGAAAVSEGDRVRGVVVENAAGRQVLKADVVIDGTGHADIAVAAGAAWSKGRPTDGFLHEVSQRALRDPTHVRDISAAYLRAPMGPLVMAIRESRRIEGDHVVRFDEAIREEVYPDTICRWRSNYDTHFPNSPNQTDAGQDWTTILGLWRRPILGSIPYRSLLPRGLEGIIVAGKAYSTDHDALVGGRMQPDMEHLGEAAGIAAAMASPQGGVLRELDVAALQRALVGRGVIRDRDVPAESITEGPPEFYLRSQDFWREQRAEQFPNVWGDAGPEPRSLEQQIERLGGESALEAMVQLYLAGDRAAQLLRPLLESDRTRVREEATVLLGLMDDPVSIPALMEMLRERNPRTFEYRLPQASSRESVPLYWTAAILLGRMRVRESVPEMLELLRLPPDPEHYPLIRRREWGDNLFDGVDRCGPGLANFLIVALGRIGDERAAEAIRRMLAVGKSVELRGENLEHDLCWGIPTNAAWALAQMGDRTGVPVLIEFLRADQALLRSYAHRLLMEITGESFGPEPGAWRQWWERERG